MPVSAKKAANDRRARPNSLSRRERTRNEGKCQLCETKTPIKNQFTVVNDLEAGTATKRKNAGAKGNENSSHYCGDCAAKRVEQKEAWMRSRNGETKPKGKASKKGKGKAGKKAAKKPVKKPLKKPAKKPKGKAKKGGSKKEPF